MLQNPPPPQRAACADAEREVKMNIQYPNPRVFTQRRRDAENKTQESHASAPLRLCEEKNPKRIPLGHWTFRVGCWIFISLCSSVSLCETQTDLIPLQIAFPSPAKWPGSVAGTTSPNLEPDRDGKPYPPILVPKGCDQLLSTNCKVTSSDPAPPVGDLSFVTDGKKDEAVDENVRLVLNNGLQWIQIDLGAQKEIYAVCIWHSFSPRIRVYHDVIVQVSDDPDFMDEVVTVFNNDHDNSAKLGTGKDFEYIETHEGRPIPAHGVKGRYVRCYSNGNIRDKSNAYVEVEVYGRKYRRFF